ncbi:MAG: endonuclease [Candidatus Cloacimonetes bacterium]|nr:endonuclease [Candidatus Cloacimonadota bacterium]
MKRMILLALVLLAFGLVWGQTTLVNENIQSWTNRGSYGNYTQTIPAGTVSMTDCIVANAASATGTGSAGRAQMKASTGIIVFPALPSVGNVEFHLAAGGAGRTLLLESLSGSTWTTITTFSGIGTTGTTFYYDVNSSVSTTLRLVTESNPIYVHDIIIKDYTSSTPTLAVLSTVIASTITSSSAISGGTISSDGGSSVTARGVCWNTAINPISTGSHTTDGSGTGTFVSNLTGLTAETIYYYRAYATNAQGTSYGEEYSFSTSGNSPPAVPTAIAATSIGVNSFTANWNAATGATSYRLDVSAFSSFSPLLSSYSDLTVNTTSQAVSGLSANTTYYYRVRAYNTNGTSANSNIISAKTLAGDAFNGYYNPVIGLSGTALKTGLHDLIDSNTYSNYDGAKTFLFQTLDNVGGVVRCVYTGQDYPISGSYNGSSSPNTEHTYAQSWFGTSEASTKKADVHHLFVTNSNVNSSRGNLPFDVVTNASNTYSYANGYVSKRGTNASGKTVFEPSDQHKGNLARALLYFNVRYNMTLSQGGVDMLSRLIEWHNADPVNPDELTRNTAVYGHQGNRNPFVDHPEYVASIWGGAAASTVVQFNPASAIVNEADGTVTLTVQILNPSATATTAQIALTDGSASDVGNFATRYITFPANSSTNQTISVTITDDSILEGTETLIFSLVNVSGGNSAVAGNYNSFNLDIEDNDIPTPVATAATNIDFTSFTANWNAAAGITDYMFDLSTASNFSSFVSGYENLALSATSLAISGLTAGTNYYYRVKSVYNESEGAYSNTISTSTSAIVVIDVPVATAATAVSHEGFTARWDAVSGADNYRLDVFSGSGGTATDLLISEYVEGSSNNKYLEIYNGTGANVDLTNYQLKLYPNGAVAPYSTNTLEGILANGACVVYRNSGAVLTLPGGVTAISSTATNFNGNDAVELYKVSPAGSVDIFGKIGQDPGTAWVSTPLTTLNKTLRRKSTVLSGVTVNPTAGFPTLATEWESFAEDTASGLGSHSIGGGTSPVAGYQNLTITTNAARVANLSPETSYTYRVRAENSSYLTANSNTITAITTATVVGTGANTAIGGAASTVLVPALSGYTNNNVAIDPTVSSSDDFSVTVATITGGIRYSITSSNNNAYNGAYVLNHAGLGYAPATLLYRFNSVETSASTFSSTVTQTSITLSGLSGTGTLEIDLLQAPQTLDTPMLTISVSGDTVTLSWNYIANATSYQIDSGDTPYGPFTPTTTSLNTWSETSTTRKFYRVTALRN